MTALTMPDVQNTPDTRNTPINKVGIKSIRHPVKVAERSGNTQHTVGLFDMYVYLPAEFKGTHMSRFVAILNQQSQAITLDSFQNIVATMVQQLAAPAGYIQMNFPYFVNKAAPISGVSSLLDYDVTYIGEIHDGSYRLTMKVIVPVTSLCPCSKQISQYGAHNQRSHITLSTCITDLVWIEEIIDIAEQEASCQLYGLLKRSDEKFVTEYAYENPKFVEDVVRDIAAHLAADPRILSFVVESENFESIHNHSAYALIECDKSIA